MRAVVITSHGGVGGIGVMEVESPSAPVADRVRVRVHAAGLNHADILQRRGSYPAPPGYPQNIPGLEFAGEVEAIGDAVGAWKIGDRVFGIIAGGAQAELVVVPESNLARVPTQLSWAEAGAIPEVFITAHDALFTPAGLKMGDRVLVHAAASGVGTAAVQLAHAVGATVYGTSRNADKLNRMRELKLGMDESVAVGDAPAKFAEAVQRWTNDAGVDVILDLVGGSYFPPSLEALSIRGRIISVGTTAGAKSEIDLDLLKRKRGRDYRDNASHTFDRGESRRDSPLCRRCPAPGIARQDPPGDRPCVSHRSSSRCARTAGVESQLRQNRADVCLNKREVRHGDRDYTACPKCRRLPIAQSNSAK